MKFENNALVLYKGQPAVIIAQDTDKFEIQLKTGKKRVREKDFVLLNKGPVSSVSDVIKKEAPEADFAEAADFFHGETVTFADLSALLWDSLEPSFYWACWNAVSTSPWFICTTPDQEIYIRNAEEVAAIIKAAEEKNEEESAREAFITRLKNTSAGKDGGILRPNDDRFLQEIEALALGTSTKSKSLAQAGIAETSQQAHRILLACEYWQDSRNPWPTRHGLTLASSPIPIDPPKESTTRMDLTALDSWAIDNDWSADPDDAISLENDALWIHVADPAETVLPDSPADIAARARGSTLYVPEGASRMLSEESLKYYALGLSDTSLALSFKIQFTETGAIDEVSIHRTIIKVTQLKYSEVSLRANDPAFSRFFELAERNKARRDAAGGVQINLPEVHISVDTDKPPQEQICITPIKTEPAAEMIREMMLIAGEATARFAFKNRIPFQYVSQDKPEFPSTLPEELAGEYRKRRSMRARKVGTIPADHAGLGIGMYAQVTSPLRRYGDLVGHQQLHRFLSGEPLMDTDDMLMRIAAGDAAARECTLCERESNLHWKLLFLSCNQKWQGEGVIVEKNDNNATATVLIPELAMEYRIPCPAETALNDRVKLSVSRISIPDQTVSFILA